MIKKIAYFSILFSPSLLASKTVELYNAPLSSLNKLPIIQQPLRSTGAKPTPTPKMDGLQLVNKTTEGNVSITRYQQLYKGIPIIGSQVMITQEKQGLTARNNAEVNGQLMEDIQLITKPSISSNDALKLAKDNFFLTIPSVATSQSESQLQIRADQDEVLKLVYLVSFKTLNQDNKPVWPFYVVDAQTGEILTQWNNIKTYIDHGPGGNEKVHEYWYGQDGLPALDVKQVGNECILDNNHVSVVHLNSTWDWDNNLLTPYQYTCGNNIEEPINGAYSTSNDAYYFGQTIVNMYKQWYGVPALQNSNGNAMKLIMRVHFGNNYDNAFWDGETMSFGDGLEFYPLVTLDIAGHEVTHGFTEQHSNLEYHDQSGALNESVSDMAGQAARAYLLESNANFYNKAYLQANQVTWGIGETITKSPTVRALRYMDTPSLDGNSADCLDKRLAIRNGEQCRISYPELIARARYILDPAERQSYIVHTASGVFNKAFYLLSQKIGIKQAYHLMLRANTKYWKQDTNFIKGACGVIYAAKELNVDPGTVKTVFAKVGIQTVLCSKV